MKRDNKAPQKGAERGISKRARIIFRVLYILLLVVVSITSFSIGAVFAYKDYLFSLPAYVPVNVEATMVNEEGSFVNISEVIAAETTVIPIPQYDHIHNILLIGTDSRSQTYSQSGAGSRADIIMVMSVDEKESSIKLISIARDSYAFIPGFDNPEKINAAMAYGGPELLMATIEGALRIELDEYAFVNFYHMEKVIDTVGGVYVHVSEAERTAEGGLNSLLSFDNLERNIDINTGLVAQSGTQKLYGRQAVAYSRIRYVGNGDYDRSNRQVEVLQSLLKQFTSISLKDQASTMEHILPHVATNISQDQIEWYAFSFLSKLESPEFVYKQLPIEGYFNQGMYSDITPGQWSIRPDWNGMIPIVQEFIYGETFPVDPVPLIPKAPEMTVD